MAKYDVSFKVGEEGTSDVIKKIEKLQKEIDALTKGEKTVNVKANVDASSVQSAAEQVSSASKQIDGFRENVISLGDAFQGLGSVAMGSGNLLQQFGSFFGSDIIGTAVRTVTSYGTILASNGLSKAIDRFDTMETFPKMMSMMGYDATEAAAAVQTLNDAVLGLPTSLSDIVSQAQNFTTITGDLQKGVEYAIAANNTFLAGGADTSQVYYGTKQLQDLMSAGSLQSMEWQSLIKAMGPSWREIGKQMGYSEDQLTDFRQSLIKGEIDGTEFLEAMVKAATGTGKLAEMAGLSKEQIGSSLTNIQTAFASLGQSVIETLDDGFQESQGITLAEKIQEIGSAVKNDLKPYVVDFVDNNFPKIEAFIDKLESYDWMGMIQKVAEWAGTLFELYSDILTKVPSSVVAFGMTFATPLGKALSGIGSFIYGLGNLSALKGIKLGKTATTMDAAGTFIEGLKGIGLKTLNAAGMVGIIAEIGLVIKEYTGVVQAISDIKIGSQFTKNLKYVTAFFGSAGVITAGVVGIMSALSNAGFGVAVATGELLSAGLVGVIALTGAVIAEYADVINTIGGLNLNANKLDKNLDIISGSMAKMQGIMGVQGLVGIFAGIPELIASGLLAIDSAAIGTLVDTLVKISEINDLDVDWDKLQQNIANIKKALDALTDDENFWTAADKADVANSMKKASSKMGDIFDAWIDIVEAYNEHFTGEDGEVEDTSDMSGKIAEDAATINSTFTALTDQIGVIKSWSLSTVASDMLSAIEDLDTILDTWYKIQEKFAEFQSSFKTIRVSETGDVIGKESVTKKPTWWKSFLGWGLSEKTKDDLGLYESDTHTDLQNTIKEITDTLDMLTDGTNAIETTFQAWESAGLNMASVHLSSMLAVWTSIQDSFKDYEVVDISSTINAIIDQIRSMVNHATGGDVEGFILGTDGTIIGQKFKNSGVWSNFWEGITGGLKADNISKLSDGLQNIINAIDAYKDLVTAMEGVEIDETVFDTTRTLMSDLVDLFDGWQSPDTTGVQPIIDIADELYTLIDTLVFTSEYIQLAGYEAIGHLKTFLGTKIKDFLVAIADVDPDDVDEQVGNIQHLFDRINILFGVIKEMDITEPQTKLMQMTTMLNEQVVELLTSLMTVQAFLTQLGADGDEIPVIQMLMNIFTGLDAAFSSDGAEGFNEQLVTLAENLDNITLSIYEMYSALTEMQPVIEGYATVMDETILPDIDDVWTYITMIAEAIPILSDAILLFRDSQLLFLNEDLETLKTWLDDIAHAFQIDLVAAMGYASQGMQQLRTETTNLTEAIINLKTAVDDLIKSLKKLQQELQKTKQQMKQCTQAAKELAAAINAIPDHKTITIDIVTNGEVPSFASTGGMITDHGVIYRSKGGFTPKGTDTVPAMLTPGEFVMNTKAVKAMGPSFFRKLNHLDIEGAMAQVSRRFSPMAYSVNNITNHDNHATVNQYITTNNEQYSYRRARRFVEAL